MSQLLKDTPGAKVCLDDILTENDKRLLANHPLIKNFGIEGRYLVVYLKPFDVHGGGYSKGMLLCNIPGCRLVLRVAGQSGVYFRVWRLDCDWGLVYPRYSHPFSFGGGGLCLGNSKGILYRLLREREFVLAIFLLIRFLTIVNRFRGEYG
jgi:hypothetical protein